MAGKLADGKRFMLYAQSGCSVVRMLTRDEGEAMVLAGTAHRRRDDFSGQVIGYQQGLSKAAERGDYDLRVAATCGTLTSAEMVINAAAGAFREDRSRTRGLPEDRRLALRSPEDIVERVQAKVRVYAYVGSAKGDILRVWPR